MPVKVPEKVLEDLYAVRESGRTNMLDRKRVEAIALGMDYPETMTWIENNPEKYSEGVMV